MEKLTPARPPATRSHRMGAGAVPLNQAPGVTIRPLPRFPPREEREKIVASPQQGLIQRQ